MFHALAKENHICSCSYSPLSKKNLLNRGISKQTNNNRKLTPSGPNYLIVETKNDQSIKNQGPGAVSNLAGLLSCQSANFQKSAIICL
jgi:hypothetical protein